MKKNFLNWMMAVALVATPMMFVACGDDDEDDYDPRSEQPTGDQTGDLTEDEPESKLITIDFEGAQLNDGGYWIGDVNGVEKAGYYGPEWACTYTEDIANVNMTFGGSYWSGFAISACTGTTFTDGYMGADQYNNITGKAASGKNFLVIQQAYGQENISFTKPVTVKEFMFTNSAVAVNSIVNGDDYESKFTEKDWLACDVIGMHSDSTTVVCRLDLAKDGSYVDSWTAIQEPKDFSDIISLQFTFDGSRTGQWGLNTPAYVCIDKLVIEPKE